MSNYRTASNPRALYVSLPVGLMLACCESTAWGQKPMSDVERNQKVAQAMREIEQCPPWTKIGAKDVSRRRELIKHLDRLAGEETSVLRTAISRLMAEWPKTGVESLDNMSKIFVLNRYIFKVPSKLRRDKVRFFGGWIGVPSDDKEVNLLWPFAHSKDGKLELVGEYGAYLGENFQAIQEFDWLNQRFGRRDTK